MSCLRRASISTIAKTRRTCQIKTWTGPSQEMEAVAADQNVPVGIHLQEVPVLAVDHHAAVEREKGDQRSVHHWLKLPGPGPTVWGSWGRRCSAAAREGTRRTPAGLGSSGSPGSRIRGTCTLQKNTDVVRWDLSAAPDLRGFCTYSPWCSPCRSRSI